MEFPPLHPGQLGIFRRMTTAIERATTETAPAESHRVVFDFSGEHDTLGAWVNSWLTHERLPKLNVTQRGSLVAFSARSGSHDADANTTSGSTGGTQTGTETGRIRFSADGRFLEWDLNDKGIFAASTKHLQSEQGNTMTDTETQAFLEGCETSRFGHPEHDGMMAQIRAAVLRASEGVLTEAIGVGELPEPTEDDIRRFDAHVNIEDTVIPVLCRAHLRALRGESGDEESDDAEGYYSEEESE